MRNILILGNRYTQSLDSMEETHFRSSILACELVKANKKVVFGLFDFITKEYKCKEKIFLRYSIPFDLRRFLLRARIRINQIITQHDIDTVILTNGPIVAFSYFLIRKKNKLQLIYDQQDNYRAYPYRFHLYMFGSLIDIIVRARADVCTFVSTRLMQKDRVSKEKFYFPMGVFTDMFKPLDIIKCREKFAFKPNDFIIGYIGQVDARIHENILKIAEILKQKDYHFVVAGALHGNKLPSSIDYLGLLKPSLMPHLINAFDIALAPYNDTPFTRYCFPQKIIEYMSCGINILASDIQTHRLLLKQESIFSMDLRNFIDKLRKSKICKN